MVKIILHVCLTLHLKMHFYIFSQLHQSAPNMYYENLPKVHLKFNYQLYLKSSSWITPRKFQNHYTPAQKEELLNEKLFQCTFRYNLKILSVLPPSAFTMSSSTDHRKDLQLSVSNNEIKNVLKDPYFIAGSDFTNNSGINGFDVCNISNLCIILHSLAKFFLLSW